MKRHPAINRAPLRRAAEAQVKARPAQPPQGEADARKLQHELEVHKTELEMQNEQLRAAEAEIILGLESYTELYDFAPVGYFNLTADGTICLVNLTGATLLGLERARLQGRHFSLFLTENSRLAFREFFNLVSSTEAKQACEVVVLKNNTPGSAVRLEAVRSADAKEIRIVMSDIAERKQAEAALRESEEKYRSLFESSRDAIMTLDPATGRFASGNPAALAMFAVKDEAEFVARGPMDLSPERQPDGRVSREAARSMIEIAMGEGSQFFEWRHRRINGEEFSADVRLTRLEMRGKPVVMAVVRDITGRKQAEAALRQSQERYVLAEQCVNDGLWDWNRLTGDESFSPRWKEIIGYGPDEFPNQRQAFLNQLHPDDLPGVQEITRRHLELGERYAIEFRLRHKDGSYRWVFSRGEAVRDAAGQPIRMVGAITDITERKQAEQAMRENERLLRAVIDLVPHLIFVKDGQSRHLLANQATAAASGRTPQEIEGKCDLEFLADRAQAEAFMQDDREVMASGKQKIIPEQCLTDATGEMRLLQTIKIPFVWRGDPAIVGVALDITEHNRAELALREREAQLRLYAEHSPAAIAMLDCNMKYLVVSRRWMQDYRLGDQSLIGRSHYEVFPEIPPRWKEIHRRCLAGAIERNDEDNFPRTDGMTNWLRWEIRPWHQADGTIGGIIIFSEDITGRKLAEQTLRESEERYRQLFELESDAIFLVDRKTHRFVEANQSARRLYGYSREEFLQLTAEQVSAEPEKTRATVASGSIFVPLRWHRKKNGERFPVEITANVIQHQGRWVELTAIRDITERQKAMETLQEKTEQLLEAQHLASLGYYQFNARTGFWTSSRELDAIFGITDSAFVRDVAGWMDLVHPQDRAEMRRYLNEDVVKGRVPFDRSYRIVRLNDQQERWVHGIGKLAMDDAGQVVMMVGVIQDITNRKRAEEKAHLQFSALTSAANAIVITDRQGKIEWVNPSFTKLTGYSEMEAIGSYPRMLKSGQQTHGFYASMWATILTGNIWHGEVINKRKDGRLYTEDMTITPVRGADGQIAHFVAIKEDVTERRALQKQLQQTQKLEAVGTLAGGIAHDFNNILGAIIAFTEMTKTDHQQDNELQENLDEVLKASQRAVNLVKQILSFSRQQQLERRSLQLAPIVKEALKLLRATLPTTITLNQAIAADLPDVLADPTQMHQVMMNLCTNAAHAMRDQHGTLCVQLDDLHLPPDGPLPHAELSSGDYVRLVISDTGHGIEASILERIFEPFFTTKGPGEGTGLGLSVVHGIVKEHEGVIAVESQPGQGTTFTIYLPAKSVSENSEGEAGSEIPRGGGERILFVDDEEVLGKVANRVLRQLGYQPFVFSSAEAAWNAIQENPAAYDMVVTDLTMPVMTGLELATKVFNLRPDLPILLSSGNSAALTAEEFKALGIRALLTKPLNVERIAIAINSVLRAPAQPK